jgi:hypothetical protein
MLTQKGASQKSKTRTSLQQLASRVSATTDWLKDPTQGVWGHVDAQLETALRTVHGYGSFCRASHSVCIYPMSALAQPINLLGRPT